MISWSIVKAKTSLDRILANKCSLSFRIMNWSVHVHGMLLCSSARSDASNNWIIARREEAFLLRTSLTVSS